MNIILDDMQLNKMLTKAQLLALVRLRDCALHMRCNTLRDSVAMTAMNMLPLFIKERGVEWAPTELSRILVLLIGSQPDKRACRQAAKHLLDLLQQS